jgi:2-polyprenyl-3-methyl-5-hydroxy-6-metoxy-1,4-benzoquinol methylase
VIERVPADVALRRLRDAVERTAAEHERLRVLDAGCGADSTNAGFPVPEAFKAAHVVGVDVAEEALARNALLDERIVGDLESVSLPDGAFDVVVCWDVLEHLPDPLAALRNIGAAVAPGGVLFVGFPNVHSVKGLVTKLSPFWFHVFLYRHVFRMTQGPFRTYLRWTLAPSRLQAAVEGLGFDTELAALSCEPPEAIFGSSSMVAALWRRFARAAQVVSLGRLDAEASEVVFAFRRRREARADAGSSN